MIKLHPDHLYNQELTVVSGTVGYDDYGDETYDSQVVSSGTGRLQISYERVVDATGTVLDTGIKAYVSPTLSVAVGQYVEAASKKFKVVQVIPQYDGRGLLRLQTVMLEEAT